MKLSKLTKKMVVNQVNGEMIGYIVDLEIDLVNFQVTYFMVEEKPGIFARMIPWVFKTKSMQVRVDNIDSIGSDVVLIASEKRK